MAINPPLYSLKDYWSQTSEFADFSYGPMGEEDAGLCQALSGSDPPCKKQAVRHGLCWGHDAQRRQGRLPYTSLRRVRARGSGSMCRFVDGFGSRCSDRSLPKLRFCLLHSPNKQHRIEPDPDDSATSRVFLFGRGHRETGLFFLVDTEHVTLIVQYRWHADTTQSHGDNRRIHIKSSKSAISTFIWENADHPNKGVVPDGWLLDHRSGFGYDNRVGNLKLIPDGWNAGNCAIHGREHLRGVGQDKASGRWRARVSHNGKSYSGGTHITQTEAIRAAQALRTALGMYHNPDRHKIPDELPTPNLECLALAETSYPPCPEQATEGGMCTTHKHRRMRGLPMIPVANFPGRCQRFRCIALDDTDAPCQAPACSRGFCNAHAIQRRSGRSLRPVRVRGK